MSDVRKGAQVMVKVNPHLNNGDDEAFGFVTKVVDGDPVTLNVRAFLDTGADLRLTNIALVDGPDDVEQDDDLEYDAPKVAWVLRD